MVVTAFVVTSVMSTIFSASPTSLPVAARMGFMLASFTPILTSSSSTALSFSSSFSEYVRTRLYAFSQAMASLNCFSAAKAATFSLISFSIAVQWVGLTRTRIFSTANCRSSASTSALPVVGARHRASRAKSYLPPATLLSTNGATRDVTHFT